MTTVTGITVPQGSEEYVVAEVTADVELDDQTVEIALRVGSGAYTWLPGTWEGDAGTTRKVRTTSTVQFTAEDYPVQAYHVAVRLTDNPEVPIIPAGILRVTA